MAYLGKSNSIAAVGVEHDAQEGRRAEKSFSARIQAYASSVQRARPRFRPTGPGTSAGVLDYRPHVAIALVETRVGAKAFVGHRKHNDRVDPH